MAKVLRAIAALAALVLAGGAGYRWL